MNQNLGEFEQLILLALVRLDADAYGVSIRCEIEERTGRSVSAGAVYTALARLEARQMVHSQLADTTPSRGGRPRKYYRLTSAGALALQGAVEQFRVMTAGLTPALDALGAGTDTTAE